MFIRNLVIFVLAVLLLCIDEACFVLCLYKFQAARLVSLSLLCCQSWLLHFLFAPIKSNVQGSGFLVSEGAQIDWRLSVQYVNSVLPQRSIYEWIEKFKNSCTSVSYDEGAGRPLTATNEENIESSREILTLLLTKWQIVYKLVMVLPVKETMHSWLTAQLFMRASWSFYNDGPSALKSMRTVEKWCTCKFPICLQ